MNHTIELTSTTYTRINIINGNNYDKCYTFLANSIVNNYHTLSSSSETHGYTCFTLINARSGFDVIMNVTVN